MRTDTSYPQNVFTNTALCMLKYFSKMHKQQLLNSSSIHTTVFSWKFRMPLTVKSINGDCNFFLPFFTHEYCHWFTLLQFQFFRYWVIKELCFSFSVMLLYVTDLLDTSFIASCWDITIFVIKPLCHK